MIGLEIGLSEVRPFNDSHIRLAPSFLLGGAGGALRAQPKELRANPSLKR